ncbi:hypothetical protein ACQKFG_13905 [Peribacillus sp. NPDC076916]|uniref:hypothetical protein n=1 Tax=Peribacillus sp. NPDC076916 TaxID=3390608 RepID=UPI003D0155F1
MNRLIRISREVILYVDLWKNIVENERKRPVRLSGIQGNSPGNIEGWYGNENDTKNRQKFNLMFQYEFLKKTVDKLGEVEFVYSFSQQHATNGFFYSVL